MILCSICQTENDQYSIVCGKCGAFLQNRVPNLDLFATLWGTLENPKNAFRLIILAEHKNYTLFLYVLFGICVSFSGFWYFQLGERFENVLPLIFWALVSGILLGVILCPVVTFFHWSISKMFGGKTTFRNSLGITSYAFTPLILSLVFVLPIELMTFGLYLFSFNPHPITIKPTLYIVLLSFDVVLILWGLILSIVGTKVGNQIPLWKSISTVVLLYGIVASGLLTGGEYAIRYF